MESEGGDRRGFAERRLFGRYLGDILDAARDGGNVELVHATVTAATRKDGGWRLALEDGSAIEAGAIVLAVGNQEPEPLSAFTAAGDRFIRNPWGTAAREAVGELAASGESALLVGTGLTMVDLVLSLDAAGYRGRIVALSRRGQIPRSHADFEPAPVEAEEVPHGTLRGLWRWLRKRSAEVGWRAAVDSLRPYSHPLWQSLDAGQQRRFLRHARPWWDVHRHRIAPEVARTVAGLVGDGRLEVMAGRIVSARAEGEGLTCSFAGAGPADPGQAVRLRLQLHRAAPCDRPDAGSAAPQPVRRRSHPVRPSRDRARGRRTLARRRAAVGARAADQGPILGDHRRP